MTPEQKVAMLKEAGVWDVIGFPSCIDKLFALVAAHEREKHNSPSWETVDDAIAAEREACAKVCDEQFKKYGCVADKCAAAIRARGEK